MLKNLLARGRVFFVTLAIIVLTITAIMAFVPGLFLSVKIIATAMMSEVVFRLEGNQGIIWNALGAKGPGYTNLHVLTSEGDLHKFPGILITFQVEIETTETPLLCHGQVQYYRSDPSYMDLEWQDANCAQQSRIVSLAHFTMSKNSLHTALREEDVEPVAQLLIHWIEEGKVRLSKIRNPGMRELIDPRSHSYP